MWFYNEKEFTSSDIGDYVGFVYVIHEKDTGKKYVGKKVFKSKVRKPPLKGKTKRRVIVKESDWMDYYGSSEQVKALVEEKGSEAFHREILHLCKTKGEMSYLETLELFERRVLFSTEYYNGIIQCKIHRNHVQSLMEKFDGRETY